MGIGIGKSSDISLSDLKGKRVVEMYTTVKDSYLFLITNNETYKIKISGYKKELNRIKEYTPLLVENTGDNSLTLKYGDHRYVVHVCENSKIYKK